MKVLAATLLIAICVGLLLRRANGRLREVDADSLDLAALGLPKGERATLVQFTSAFCAPCRATRRILNEVAGMVDGVEYAEIDAEAHLDLVRRLDVVRTPTTLVLDPAGRIVVRASGQPRKADVVAALGRVVST